MAEMDNILARKQSVVLILILPIAIGLVSYFFGDSLVSGVLSGLLMAVILLLLYYRLGILGNPEYAGWFSEK
ncbi:hypothetical protein Harman_28710 [Haloarcula mannanilytica]|uniref:Uncharacterized protein n=1 Tax=Haloarcula mannanilytica TaxID=2509225 RepID=A0A4C2EKS5_9EURY|nr:hypothetical protein Harman_28710 [Haloarcula mannanilytica]